MRTRFLVAFIPLVVLAAGCSKKDTLQSTDLTTHGMSLDYKVIDDGTRADVQVYIHAGDANGNEFVQLQPGDNLVLHVGTQTFGFTQNQDAPTANGTRTWYQTFVNGVTSGDFVVDFTRTSGASALNNKITLPPSFNLTVPTGTISRKNMLTVQWDGVGTGYDVSLTADGDCIQHQAKSVIGEPGSIVLNAGDLAALAGHENDVCAVTIKVQREILAQESGGNFSSEFGHTSQRDAVQIRSVTIQSGP